MIVQIPCLSVLLPRLTPAGWGFANHTDHLSAPSPGDSKDFNDNAPEELSIVFKILPTREHIRDCTAKYQH